MCTEFLIEIYYEKCDASIDMAGVVGYLRKTENNVIYFILI